MARAKLSEFHAKQLLYQELNTDYPGISVEVDETGKLHASSPLSKLSAKKEYVVKVDQGVKGRMKKGLVQLRIKKEKIRDSAKKLARKGYSRFIIEEMVPHDQQHERYLSIERTREGIVVRYSQQGGIDIEQMMKEVKTVIMDDKQIKKIARELGVEDVFIDTLRVYFEKNYLSFLEINPLVVIDTLPFILDLAVEVDSTAQFFVKGWSEQDIVGEQHQTPEEIAIKKLNDNSQAALSFTILNPDGAIWVLLSGGGASITLADEFYNLGYGKQLGNYGEYSGNPNAEETYLYTKEVLKALFKSNATKKVVLIGGGVANFTDVRVTFKGILQAFEDNKSTMKKHNIVVYVRRGGPKQKEGLQMMETWLKEHHMYGLVAGPELPLHEIVRESVRKLK